jgi:hypothetical protein
VLGGRSWALKEWKGRGGGGGGVQGGGARPPGGGGEDMGMQCGVQGTLEGCQRQ